MSCMHRKSAVQYTCVFSLINSLFLCLCYFLYTFDWMGHLSHSCRTGNVITYMTATSAVFCFLLSIAYLMVSWYLSRKVHGYSSGIVVILTTCSFASLIYAIIASSTMFMRLYVKFNPSCLDNTIAKGETLYITIVSAYHLLSFLVLLLISILLLDSTSTLAAESDVNFGVDGEYIAKMEFLGEPAFV